ncbi:MAG: leucine-rich repeat domain-containing protein [Lachnospiraceae bacterium]|nr:leucine-rich repeat domain-containing protein [Lachnospiraceae bacterium]
MKKILFVLCCMFVLFGATNTASAYSTDGDYNYNLNGDGTTVTLLGYMGSATEVVVPKTLGGYPVTAIETYAFAATAVKKVTLPEGLVEILDNAFMECKMLEEVVLPSTLKFIGVESFLQCDKLKSITVPESVTTISFRGLGYTWVTSMECGLLSGFTIHGKTGSAAQTYANENGITFVATDKQPDIVNPDNGNSSSNPNGNTSNTPNNNIISNPNNNLNNNSNNVLNNTTKLPNVDKNTDSLKPKKVTKVKVKAIGKRKVRVTFKKSEHTGYYEFRYSLKKNMKKAINGGTAGKVVLKKLPKGARIYIQVRGVNGDERGAWSKKVSVKVK